MLPWTERHCKYDFLYLPLYFWCINNIKAQNEKFIIIETKIDGVWVGFEPNFKPSILKQDKGVWFSGIEMPENAVRQGLSAFQIVILLRMIPNSYAVEAVFRRKSRFLRIHLSVAVWWLKIEKFWQRREQKLTSLLKIRVTSQAKTKNSLQAICASLWTKNRAKYSTWLLKHISVLCAWKGGIQYENKHKSKR